MLPKEFPAEKDGRKSERICYSYLKTGLCGSLDTQEDSLNLCVKSPLTVFGHCY